MNAEPKVQVTSAPGLKGQFGKGTFVYQKPPKKVSAPAVAGSVGVVLVCVVVMVFSGSPSKDRSDTTSKFLGVEVPQTIQTIPTMDIPRSDVQISANQAKGVKSTKPVMKFSGPELLSRPRNVLIPPGSMVAAILVSGASDGPVKAEMKEPLIVAGEPLLDAGTVLVGSGQSGEDRLAIHFRKAVFSDGSVAKIAAQAADNSDKIAGIKGSHVGYRALKLAAGVGLNFAAGLSQGLQETQGQGGAVVTTPTMKNALLNGAARASLEEGQNIMNEYRNEKPVIEVSAGTAIYILFDDAN